MPLKRNMLFAIGLLGYALSAGAGSIPDESFQRGMESYRAGDFTTSAKSFGDCAAREPSSGAWQNLGLAEWRSGHVGEAIVAWERANWLNPANQAAQVNLHFARKAAQLESPVLA